MSEDELIGVLDAETRATEIYANMFPSSPADKAYIKQALTSAAEEIKREAAIKHNEVEASETKEIDGQQILSLNTQHQ